MAIDDWDEDGMKEMQHNTKIVSTVHPATKKKCIGCKKAKLMIGFPRNKARSDGYNNTCKDCENARQKRNRENIYKQDTTPEMIAILSKAWL